MRHSPEPANHSRLLATVAAVLVCFAALIAAKAWDEHDAAAITAQVQQGANK